MARTYDVIAFQDAGFDILKLTSQSIFSPADVASLCTGIQKLVQRWLLEFLTNRGSMGFHLANRGTDFLRVFRNRAFSTESEVRSQFNFASVAVYQNLLREWTANTPDDEKLASATLTGVTIQPGFLTLAIRIDTVAGTSASFSAPILVLPSLEL